MKPTLRILIVEDDKYFLLQLKEILAPFGVIEAAMAWPEAQPLLKDNVYDLIVTDLHLPDGPQGLLVLEMARKQNAMRLMLTSSSDEELISKAYQLGAQHVLTKSQVAQNLPAFIRSLLAQKDLQRLNQFFNDRFPTKNSILQQEITRLLTSPWQGRSLIITGPTGTGKSVLGKLLAENLMGTDAPFIHLNCSEIPDNLLESELFGHEKGAFTGADSKKIGKLKAADGGVLFLDEVGTMSPSMQQKLLKAIEERTFYPVGSTKAEKSSFTLITATCEDLQLKIQQGVFREDLYFRLSGLQLTLPSLRERSEDIENLIRFFQQQSPRRYVLTPEAMSLLKMHSWPGNLRELRQTLLSLADIGAGVVTDQNIKGILSVNPVASENTGLINTEIRAYIKSHGLRAYFQQVEKEIAQEALLRHGGRITSCIKELKISSSAFYRILQENQLNQ
jgi:DNA-binding NtrC family response regulator